MENEENEWTKPENPEVEAGKDAFAEAQQVAVLREKISQYAATAVEYGNVDRDWVNAQLVQLGAKPVTGSAYYKINVPISGNYGTTVLANSRTEALEEFGQYTAALANAGQITRLPHYSEGIYNLTVEPEAPTFYAGPEDPEAYDGPVLGLNALKVGIREMLKQAIIEHGWGYSYAQDQLSSMGLELLPEVTYRTVSVPVSGTAKVPIRMFADEADDAAVQRAAAAAIKSAGQVLIEPDEMGAAYGPRPDGDMGLTLTDD